MTACSADKTLDMYDFTGGLVDRISADRMALKFTPDCKNVCLDADAGISTREEYIDANSTALTGSQSVLSGYVYKQDDGDQYAIIQSSNSLFAGNSASGLTVISSTFTLNKRMTYESFLGNVYGGNGTDCEWKWDGVTFTSYTVLNSTNMVKAKYHALWQNRMFRAGVTSSPLTIYYSNINVTAAGAPDPDPADLGDGTNWEYIPANGDIITAIKPSEDGSQLYIWTNESTWALIGNSKENWVLKCKSPDIGCISGETIDYLNGSMILVSKRGIEKFNGDTYTLLSGNIDKQIRGLSQLNGRIGGRLIQTTSADWGSGTGTNIDTTTYSGSVTISEGKYDYIAHGISHSTYVYVSTSGANVLLSDTNSFGGRSSITISSTALTSGTTVTFYRVYAASTSSDMGNIALGIDTPVQVYGISVSSIGVGESITVVLTYNDDNNDNIVDGSDIPASDLVVMSWNSTYSEWRTVGGSVNTALKTVTVPMVSSDISSDISSEFVDFAKNGFTTSASFTTKVFDAGDSFGEWGTFTVNEEKPSGTTISYYALLSTSSDFANQTNVSLTNGGFVPSKVGPYIKVISSYTRNSVFVFPKLNDISIYYYGENTDIPTAKVYHNSYWLSVTTQASTNNVVYRYNENGIFELYNNMNFGDFFEWYGDLYAGDSTNTGKVYKLNIGASYTDSIGDYTAEYYTPITDCGSPLTQKSYKSLWVTSSRDTVDFTVSYSIDGSDTWSTLTPTTVSTRINTYKLNFPIGLRGRYIQFKISGTKFFNVRGMSLIYEELPLQ